MDSKYPSSIGHHASPPSYPDILLSVSTPLSTNLPCYVQQADDLQDQIQMILGRARRGSFELPFHQVPLPEIRVRSRYDRAYHKVRACDIIRTFFEAIENKNDELVALFIESSIVTTETTNNTGRTPLLAAVQAGNIRTVQLLMDFDADVNAFGIVSGFPEPEYGTKPPK